MKRKFTREELFLSAGFCRGLADRNDGHMSYNERKWLKVAGEALYEFLSHSPPITIEQLLEPGWDKEGK